MGRPHYSIGALLGFVVFVAIGLAALRNPTDIWENSVFTLTMITLFVAVLLAIHRHGPSRAYWVGFALAGWIYLIATFILPVGSRLLTTKAIFYIGLKMPFSPFSSLKLADTSSAITLMDEDKSVWTTFYGSGVMIKGAPATLESLAFQGAGTRAILFGGPAMNFIAIGQSLMTVVLAILAGLLSQALYAKGRMPTAIAPSTEVGQATDQDA